MNEIEPFSFAIDEIFDRKYAFKIQNTHLHSIPLAWIEDTTLP
jgi:hypothetical protein